MPTINLPDDLYRKLAAVAAGQGKTVDEYVAWMLGPAEAIRTPAERDAAVARTAARAEARLREGRYPPGFQADVSREAMYPEGGE